MSHSIPLTNARADSQTSIAPVLHVDGDLSDKVPGSSSPATDLLEASNPGSLKRALVDSDDEGCKKPRTTPGDTSMTVTRFTLPRGHYVLVDPENILGDDHDFLGEENLDNFCPYSFLHKSKINGQIMYTVDTFGQSGTYRVLDISVNNLRTIVGRVGVGSELLAIMPLDLFRDLHSKSSACPGQYCMFSIVEDHVEGVYNHGSLILLGRETYLSVNTVSHTSTKDTDDEESISATPEDE